MITSYRKRSLGLQLLSEWCEQQQMLQAIYCCIWYGCKELARYTVPQSLQHRERATFHYINTPTGIYIQTYLLIIKSKRLICLILNVAQLFARGSSLLLWWAEAVSVLVWLMLASPGNKKLFIFKHLGLLPVKSKRWIGHLYTKCGQTHAHGCSFNFPPWLVSRGTLKGREVPYFWDGWMWHW